MASIGDYALLSDSHGAALVSRDGSIDWACLPRFDSPSVFARLLGRGAGHWGLGPGDPTEIERSYLDDTMVLRTIFRTESGVVAVTDAMPFEPAEGRHRIGHRAPHAIVRSVEGIEGEVVVDMELAPRPEYGLTTPMLMPVEGGFTSRGGPQAYVLSSSAPVDLKEGVARGRFTVRVGEKLAFALHARNPWQELGEPWPEQEVLRWLEETIDAWRRWSREHAGYQGPYREIVQHSGRVLQALTYAPTGAVVAAPTTSLPESIGGMRNWDYRYCWARDASLTMKALWVAACPDEAHRFFDFFVTAAGGHVHPEASMQVMYAVTGERELTERELEHLEGYRGSKPVRIGNGAWSQTQLDIYGGLLAAAHLLAEQVGGFDDVTGHFLVDLADVAARRWEEPDHGIWEIRGEPRHFLHSKLMCWAALDRAIDLAAALGAEAEIERWGGVREEIRAGILERGWSDRAGAYTQAFGSDALDASVLMMPIVGFLPATDVRMRATIKAVAAGLTDERGLVYRYRTDDGLPGEEGIFGICTYWLVQCLAMLGDVAKARELFETMTAFGNDVGLFSEEVDPASGEALGNFPQAFTHVGLVNAAWVIAQAEEGWSSANAVEKGLTDEVGEGGG